MARETENPLDFTSHRFGVLTDALHMGDRSATAIETPAGRRVADMSCLPKKVFQSGRGANLRLSSIRLLRVGIEHQSGRQDVPTMPKAGAENLDAVQSLQS